MCYLVIKAFALAPLFRQKALWAWCTLPQRKLRSCKEIIFGARPEHINFVAEDGIKAEIFVTELLGNEVQLHVYVQDQLHTIKTGADTKLKAGDIVSFLPQIDRIHLFDKDTQNVIKHYVEDWVLK